MTCPLCHGSLYLCKVSEKLSVTLCLNKNCTYLTKPQEMILMASFTNQSRSPCLTATITDASESIPDFSENSSNDVTNEIDWDFIDQIMEDSNLNISSLQYIYNWTTPTFCKDFPEMIVFAHCLLHLKIFTSTSCSSTIMRLRNLYTNRVSCHQNSTSLNQQFNLFNICMKEIKNTFVVPAQSTDNSQSRWFYLFHKYIKSKSDLAKQFSMAYKVTRICELCSRTIKNYASQEYVNTSIPFLNITNPSSLFKLSKNFAYSQDCPSCRFFKVVTHITFQTFPKALILNFEGSNLSINGSVDDILGIPDANLFCTAFLMEADNDSSLKLWIRHQDKGNLWACLSIESDCDSLVCYDSFADLQLAQINSSLRFAFLEHRPDITCTREESDQLTNMSSVFRSVIQDFCGSSKDDSNRIHVPKPISVTNVSHFSQQAKSSSIQSDCLIANPPENKDRLSRIFCDSLLSAKEMVKDQLPFSSLPFQKEFVMERFLTSQKTQELKKDKLVKPSQKKSTVLKSAIFKKKTLIEKSLKKCI